MQVSVRQAQPVTPASQVITGTSLEFGIHLVSLTTLLCAVGIYIYIIYPFPSLAIYVTATGLTGMKSLDDVC